MSELRSRPFIRARRMLSAALEGAELMRPHFRQSLIATRSGKAFTGTRFAALWRRAMVKAFPGEASARLGHTTTAVTKRH